MKSGFQKMRKAVKSYKLSKPFSKWTVADAKKESYVIALALFIFVWYDKDVSAIAILASLSWGGYRGIQAYYLWMAKNEHLMEMRLKYKENGLDQTKLDSIQEELESEEIESVADDIDDDI